MALPMVRMGLDHLLTGGGPQALRHLGGFRIVGEHRPDVNHRSFQLERGTSFQSKRAGASSPRTRRRSRLHRSARPNGARGTFSSVRSSTRAQPSWSCGIGSSGVPVVGVRVWQITSGSRSAVAARAGGSGDRVVLLPRCFEPSNA